MTPPILKDTKVFVWEEGFLGNSIDGGNIVRTYEGLVNPSHPQSDHLIRMLDEQVWPYSYAIPTTYFKCPKCKAVYTDNTSDLVLGKQAVDQDGNQYVSEGYVGACLHCDEDFYLFELVPPEIYPEPKELT